ncbi:MAG: glycosyltransferase family 4 protein [Actinomycetota bacterium]|nr:glycosyltransferase family 4 protein [Actinomycetota bacterium]
MRPFLDLGAVVAEGPGGFLWAALLRAHGFAGSVTVLPYLNPRRWYDVAITALYRRFADPRDRVFLGSTPSAALYSALGVAASVGEPFGIDDSRFGVRPGAERVRAELGLPPGRILLFAGRAQPDKDLYRLLATGLRARLLFSDLQVVIAAHVVDGAYLDTARRRLDGEGGVRFVVTPTPDQLADLYNVADVFVTASTSHFETFGRAPAEALACGTPAVAPRYDGFAEVLAQPGGTLVDVEVDGAGLPAVDEQLLLRAIYDVLSSPRRPPRAEISAHAIARFGRSTSIANLEYLADGAPSEPPCGAAPAYLPLPTAWEPSLAELSSREPSNALAWFWQDCDHGALAGSDGEFSAEVRRSLCVSQEAITTEPIPCR